MLRIIVICIAVLIAVTFGGMVNAYGESYPPLPEAEEALLSDENVTVTKRRFPLTLFSPGYYVFEPAGKDTTTGFIFYPGGLVDARAYAPPLRAIAEAGYRVFLITMPGDLAIFGWKRAGRIIKNNPDIEKWVIGGHSFGGSLSCRYAGAFTADLDGVVLWASYPSEVFRIDDCGLACISIYGEKDGLSTLDEIEESRMHLPAGTEFVEITGGNHTQFGWYGDTPDELQTGDNPADITRQEQQDLVVGATVNFLEGLDNPNLYVVKRFGTIEVRN
jgi:hypothetical protein